MELLNGQILGGGVELHTEGTSGGWFNSLSAAPYANHTPQLIDPPVGHGMRNHCFIWQTSFLHYPKPTATLI